MIAEGLWSLNKHFVQKGPDLAAKLPEPNQSIYETMQPRIEDSITEIILELHEVVKCLLELN